MRAAPLHGGAESALPAPKRVLYVFANGALGGAEKITWLMLKEHDPRRYQAQALFLAPGPLPKLLAATGVKVHTWQQPLRLSRPWSAARASRFVAEVLRREGIDLVHCCLAYSHLIAASPARQLGLPIVLFHHGPVGGWIDRLSSYLPTSLVLTNSVYTQSRVDKLGRRSLKAAVLPLATDVALTDEQQETYRATLNAELGLAATDVVITILARLAPGKGLDLAITALAPLLRQDSALRLLVVGGPFRHFFPHYRDELVQLINKEGLEGKVLLVGFQPDTKPFLARADLVVSASFEEAFGLTLIEGMAAGKAVISSRVGGAAEVMTDGVEGLYFTTGDGAGLREAVSRLCADAAARARMGQAGRARVERDYAPPVMRARLEAYYDRIMSKV